MHKFPRNAGINIIILLLIFLPVQLFAQSDPDEETDWENYQYDYYAPGDQTFQISLGVAVPTVYLDYQRKPMVNNAPVGGVGSLIFNYYIKPKLYVGGELSGMFVPTKGGNTMFVIPLGPRIGTQFIVGRFEFPIAASIGMAWQTFLSHRYFGMYMKGGGGALVRAKNNWAFGLSTNLYWFPQWTKEKEKNADALFLDITFSARYHF